MIAEIINVGSEILIGDILNTNSKYLSFRLSELGFDVLYHTAIGDNQLRIQQAVENALKRSDFVVLTGGLGPTKDDITKEAVSKVVLKELVEENLIRKKIENEFKLTKRQITKNNYKQSLVLKDSIVFENRFGTAPAMAVEYNGKIVILLPGPPEELISIFETEVLKYLKRFMQHVIFSKNVYIFGLTESRVDEIVADILMNKNPTVGIYAKDGQVRLRVTAKEKTKQICEKMVDQIIEEIKKRLNGYIYGIDIKNMQTALVEAFSLKNKTLAVAESCTGGLVSSSIVDVCGSSKIFKMGVVSYSNEAKVKMLNVLNSSLKKYGAVSLTVAKEMAYGVRKAANSDIGISTTGIAGPKSLTETKPVGLVYVGVSTKKETKAYKLLLSKNEEEERNKIRKLAAIFAMNKARQEVLKF